MSASAAVSTGAVLGRSVLSGLPARLLAGVWFTLSLAGAFGQGFQPVYDLRNAPGSGADAPGLLAYGRSAGDGLGWGVRVADLNGDDIDDLIVAAPEADVGSPVRDKAGAVYIWFGVAGMTGVRDVAAVAGAAPDVSILGASPQDVLTNNGSTFEVGDVNGDQVADLILGSATADGPAESRTAVGECYVVFGRTQFPAVIDLAVPGGADVTIFGADAGDSLGFGGALQLGDVNGDGLQDMLIGAPFANGPANARPTGGEVRVLLGRAAFPGTIDLAQPGEHVIYGASASDNLSYGGALTTADVNGDGLEDILIGAHSGDGADGSRLGAGEAYIVFGRSAAVGFPASLDLAQPVGQGADVVIYGATAGDLLTSNGALAAGDVNGDGIADLLLGTNGGDGPAEGRNGAGEAYVVFGRATFPGSLDLAQPGDTGANVTIYGANGGDNLTSGGALTVGDLNRDGVVDLILGARKAKGPAEARDSAGEAYLIWGRRTAFPASLDLAVQGAGGADVTIYGSVNNALLTSGGAVATGDLNGDGYTDLVLGAEEASGGVSRGKAGRSYILFGRASFPAEFDLAGDAAADVRILGADADDNLTEGGALAMGDLNGDGVADLVLGAYQADGPANARAQAGEAYVLSGIRATSEGPEIAVEQPAGVHLPFGGSRAFGGVVLGSGSTKTFTIFNQGSADISGIALSLSGAAEFQLQADGVAPTLAPGASVSFTVTFTPAALGNRTATVRLLSNDADESPFDITLTGTGTAPEISLEQPAGSALVSGDLRDLGPRATGYQVSLGFTLRNTGTAELRQLAVSLVGADAGRFSCSALAATTLAPGQSLPLTVTFAPQEVRLHEAELRLASNDADENPFVVRLQGTGIVPTPEIALEQPAGTDRASGVTCAFGSVTLGTQRTLSLLLKNIGTAALTGLTFAVQGAQAQDYVLTDPGIAELAPGASRELLLRLSPSATGLRSASLQIASSDADENPFVLNLSGTGVNPEIALEQPVGTALADDDSRSMGVVILSAQTGQSALTFTVRNTGTDALTGLALTQSGPHPQDYSFGSLSSTSVAPGGSLTFNVFFTPQAPGVRSTVVHLASNDADENPYDIRLSGTATAPDIAVEAPPGTELTSGTGTVDYGLVLVGPPGVVKTFTVRNTGTADLNNLQLSKSGAHQADFTVGSLGATSLAPGASTTFSVTLQTSAAGVKTANLRLASNDPDETQFDVALTGQVVPLEPRFGQQPGSQVVLTGAPFVLAPQITGADPKTCQWRKDGVDLPGADESALLLANPKAADAGIYSLRVSNAHGESQSLNVYLGVATRAPAALQLKRGATLKLNCAFTAPFGTTHSYRWLRDGIELADADGVAGSGTAALTVTGAQPAQSGVYTCRITLNTPNGTVQGTHGDTQVTVVEPPSVLPFTLEDAYVSQAIRIQLPVSQSPTRYKASGLPPGVVIHKTTGLISGKPTAARLVKGQRVPYQVVFTVSNAAGSFRAPAMPWTILPLPAPAIGSFSGLLDRHPGLNAGLGGAFQLTVTGKGSFSGKLSLGGAVHALKGSLTTPPGGGNPTAQLSLKRKAPLSELELEWELDLDSEQLSGSVADAQSGPVPLTARRASLRPAGVQNLTAALQPDPLVLGDAATYPQGEGFALVKLSPAGVAAWSGKLADGTALTGATTVGREGHLLLHALLYRKTGSAQGWHRLNAATGDLDSLTFDWYKGAPAKPATKGGYRLGFPRHDLVLAGGTYLPPAAGSLLFGLPESAAPAPLRLDFRHGALAALLSQELQLLAGSKLAPFTSAFALKFSPWNPAKGLFGGSFLQEGRKGLFSGAFVTRLNRGAGHFLLPAAAAPTEPLSGRAALAPPP